MVEKTENFLEDIHRRNYEDPFLQRMCRWNSWVDPTNRTTESLNGKWNFAPDWYDTCRRAAWYRERVKDSEGHPLPLDFDWESWERIPVPSCWNLQKPELLYFEGAGVYTRTFRYRPLQEAERVFLYFEGANYRTTVFLNGIHMGTHDGGSTPFSMEITDTIREENRIVVSVEAYRRPERVPMENTDWFNYGGIYRDVYLLRLPPRFIRHWFLRLQGDGSFSTLLFNVEVDEGKEPIPVSVQLRIPKLGIDVPIVIQGGKGNACIPLRTAPELWSPEHPYLYPVEMLLKEEKKGNGETRRWDRVEDRIGLREIRVEGQNILLNGKPVFLKGVSLHEDHLELGKATTPEILRSTIRHLRELNGNYLRLSHYPHHPRFSRIADEEGVMLWEEIPVYWAIDFTNPITYLDAENQLSELILRDRNRASVIIWSVGNENADTDPRLSFMGKLSQRARELDGSRPVSAACLVNHVKLAIEDRLAADLDIIGLNEYYGWYDPDLTKLRQLLNNSRPTKPVVICEFGGDARAGQGGTVEDLFSEERQAWIYREQLNILRSYPYIKGLSPWILYDFRCPRRLNRYQESFNRKGLIDSNRSTKKQAFAVLADFYRSL
ncbi:MAG: glycoside hydrolase family 2 [Spirochaetes bacterium]|nr:glycoside hydrolase family 2 [Spirochaetota bacterium]